MKNHPDNSLPLKNFLPKDPSAAPADSAAQDETITGFVVRRAAGETCEKSPHPVVSPETDNALPSESMLGVISYCYAKGVYSSSEIEQKLLIDPAVRDCCGDEVPDAKPSAAFAGSIAKTF